MAFNNFAEKTNCLSADKAVAVVQNNKPPDEEFSRYAVKTNVSVPQNNINRINSYCMHNEFNVCMFLVIIGTVMTKYEVYEINMVTFPAK